MFCNKIFTIPQTKPSTTGTSEKIPPEMVLTFMSTSDALPVLKKGVENRTELNFGNTRPRFTKDAGDVVY